MLSKTVILLTSLVAVSLAGSDKVGFTLNTAQPKAVLDRLNVRGYGVGAGHGIGVGHTAVLGGVGNSFGSGYNSGAGASATCRYWCRTPEGQAYCCEGNNEPAVVFPTVKPGLCPPVRPQCPPVRFFRPPTTCSSDSKCPGAEKCCFDRCLDHHTCKLPVGYY